MNEKKTKKIKKITDFYKPHISGITTYIDQLINSLTLESYFVTILTTNHSLDLEKYREFKNYEIIRCKPLFKISRGFFSMKLITTYIKIYKKYDIINIHYPLIEIFPIIFFLKKITIFNYHCLPHFNFLYKIVSLYFTIFGIIGSFLSKKIIVLSKDYFSQSIFYKIYKKKIIEIPPYIPFIELKNKQLFQKKNLIVIGFIGRICSEKGIETLIKASEILEKKNIKHQIKIAGNTNDYRFKKYINRLMSLTKNNNNIIFLGKISEQEKKDFYQNIDVLVLPSVNSFEAFGIVQLEAMSYGTPVIASNISGVRTVINNTSNGFLFNKNDHTDLVKKIVILRNNFSKNPTEIRNAVLKNYNFEKFKNSIIKIF